MRLSALLDPGLTLEGAAGREIEITGLSADSRSVFDGTVPVLIPAPPSTGARSISATRFPY